MSNLTLDASQLGAVELASTEPICVITGGPGTGKTTTLRAALDRIEAEWQRPDCTVCRGKGAVSYGAGSMRCSYCRGVGTDPDVEPFLLASPTGKAAKRLSEATGRPACTVHRLLDYGPLSDGGSGFRHNASSPIPASTVVIDEASMLDNDLTDALLDAIDPETTRIVFVGDADQLPSVGAGAVFRDLIASGEVPVARLTTLHRAAAQSWVCSQAPRVLAGEVPELGERPDFSWYHRADREEAVQLLVDVAAGMGDRGAVLVPQNVQSAGADRINRLIQGRVNPLAPGAWKIGGNAHAGVGDRVIQVRNDYTRQVFNGEIGEVRALDRKEMVVRFDDRAVRYTATAAAVSLRLAYALTIHKSQGSEWPWVAVFCHSTHTRMLSRQLLYTAITRAKEGVILLGDQKGLKAALANDRDAQRNTLLAERIRGEIGEAA